MLKNEENILPLQADESIAIIGDFAQTPRYQGAGSSVVNPTKLDSTLELIDSYPLNFKGYAQGYKRSSTSDQSLISEAVALAKKVDTVLLYVGLDEISESEGLDRTTLSLPENQLALIAAIAEVNPQIVTILSAGSVIDMSWDTASKGVLHGYLAGQAGAGAMLDILTGKYSPSGKLSETYPVDYWDLPSAKDYLAQQIKLFIRKVLTLAIVILKQSIKASNTLLDLD